MAGHVVAMGGGGFSSDPASPLDDFMLALSGAARPRVCLVPTPSGDSDRAIALFFEAFSKRECVPSCLHLFGVPDDPVDHLTAQDVIYVSGGNTANALAIWRLHGVDAALRAAWERGAVVGGVSAAPTAGSSAASPTRSARIFNHCATASASWPAVSARASTGRSSGSRDTPLSSTPASPPGTRPTTTRPSTSPGPSCTRWSVPVTAPPAIASSLAP